MPVGVGEIDRVGQEGWLVEGNVEFKPHALGEAGFGEQQVAAACPAADCEIAFGDADLRKHSGNCVGGKTFLFRRKPRGLAAGRIDHVAAEEDYALRRLVRLK